jgi:hypothetical protein
VDEVSAALAELHERRGFLALFVFLTLHIQNVLPPEAATRALPRHERDARLNTRRDADRADCPAGDARKTSRTASHGPLPPAPTVYLATHPNRTPSTAIHLVVLDHLRSLWRPAP